MADIQLLLEAERRGILPADKLGLLTEARNRGLVPPLDQPKAGDLVSQIPGTNIKAPPSTAAPERPESGFFGKLMSPLETVVTLGTSAITAPIVESAKVFGTLTSGKFGTQEGIRAGEETGRRVQQFFQPQVSPESERQTAAISNALALTGLQGVPLNMLGDISTLARPAAQQVAPAIKAPIEARQQRVRQQRIRESELAAPRIDAAKDAVDLGFALDPSVSNPNAGNRARTAAVGSTALQGNLSKLNLPQVAKAARQDLGLPETIKLDAKAFEKARNNPAITEPYNQIRSIPSVIADADVLAKIDELRVAPLLNDAGEAAAVNSFLDKIKDNLARGTDGNTAVTTISDLRRNAQEIYNRQSAGINPPSPQETKLAAANLGVANALEQAIENSITDPRLLNKYRDARTALARTYDYERATNLATGVVDPQAIAKLAAEGKPLTGNIAKIANVAANFPEVMQGGVVREPSWREKLTRSGVAGTLGGFIGSPLGLGGAIAGGAVGAGVGNVAAAAAARRVASPQYQRQRALPTDYRPIPSGLTPAEINYGPNQLVPFDFSQQAFTAPNFTFVQEPGQSRVTPARPDMTRALPAPSAEGTLNALRAEDARRAGLSRTLGQQAEARTAAAEAAARRPATGEVILELDPVTGRLREASQGVRGATPETFQNFGSSLASAAEKATAGRTFDMTAAERVAWNKTKVDLAEVAPGFKALNDKAIAEKMMDRAWVEQTAVKAREKAAAFEQLAARAANERARQTAMANRERMLDLAEQMEEGLRVARPDVSGKQQGPKTRAAQRNRLISDQEVLNQLLAK